ncbi:uncharacterized protein LOC144775812 [Lissotriton helveticus]
MDQRPESEEPLFPRHQHHHPKREETAAWTWRRDPATVPPALRSQREPVAWRVRGVSLRTCRKATHPTTQMDPLLTPRRRGNTPQHLAASLCLSPPPPDPSPPSQLLRSLLSVQPPMSPLAPAPQPLPLSPLLPSVQSLWTYSARYRLVRHRC